MHKNSKSITVLIADAHPLFIAGLRISLEQYNEFEVVGEKHDTRSLLAACKKQRPLVVIMDIFMSGFEGVKLIPKIRKASPTTRILIASQNESSFDVQSSIYEGALGYILKKASGKQFIDAIRVIAGGSSYLPNGLMSNILEAANNTRTVGNIFNLTSRELDILGALAKGSSNKVIARKFGISIRTVEAHRRNVREKTNAYNTKDLIRIAEYLGLAKDAID